MSDITLKGWHAEDIQFVNKLTPGTRVQLAHKFNYHVKYAGGNICKCELSLDAHHKDDPTIFGVHVAIVGIFTYEEGTTKEQIHIQSYKELFPFARALVASVTVNAGIPAILFPNVEIEKQSIIRFDMNGLKGDPS